jgi:hypothetical protein
VRHRKVGDEDIEPGLWRSVSFKFGLVCMLAGALGVPLGSALAQRARVRLPDCDPVICGFALLASAPLIFLALVAVSEHVLLTYLLMFLGMITLNLTWSIVADIVLVSDFCECSHPVASRARLLARTRTQFWLVLCPPGFEPGTEPFD